MPAEGRVEARGKFVKRRVGELSDKGSGCDVAPDGLKDDEEETGMMKKKRVE